MEKEIGNGAILARTKAQMPMDQAKRKDRKAMPIGHGYHARMFVAKVTKVHVLSSIWMPLGKDCMASTAWAVDRAG